MEVVDAYKVVLLKKAWWVVDISGENGDEEIVAADDAHEAKMQYSNRIKYLDLRAVRATEYDTVVCLGQEMKRFRVAGFIKQHEKTNRILELPDDEMYYVQAGYVGNSVSWWGLNNRGYTCDITKAHKYSKDEIVKQFSGAGDARIWPASHVDANISYHVDSQHLDGKLSVW